MLNIGGAVGKILAPILVIFKLIIFFSLGAALFAIIIFFATYYFQYGLSFDPDKLRKPYIKNKYHDLFRWLLIDYLERGLHSGEFREYGFTFFVGRQGAGKTISMVRYLEVMKEKYPNCLIVTNFQYYRADYVLQDWRDLMTIKNGTDGIIFAIDEIHSEYSAKNWADVPEDLLSEVSQQRKQRVKIVATAQFFTRVAKPLREQAASVVVCRTFFGRLTTNREYDALMYASKYENPLTISKRLKPLTKGSFVQSDALRACYDTYEKIKRMQNRKFIPRNERVEVGA